MATRRKSAAINLYILPELKAAAEKTAEADNRSLTSLIEKLLTDAAVAAGFLERPGVMPVQKPGAKPAGRRKG